MSKKGKTRLAIGLMSGTSLDGVDAAVVEIRDSPFHLTVLAQVFQPFDAAVRGELLRLATGEADIDELSRASAALAYHYVDAIESLLSVSGMRPERISVIGCHGQTVRHLPAPSPSLGKEVRATLQIGNAAVLAERTGIAVVSDFRSRDIAAGGQGAPLVPIFDYLLLRDEKIGRVVLNIGGIANVTLLPPGVKQEGVIAFDTGPGNVLMDLLASRISGGERNSDRDGEIAARGKVVKPLLNRLLDHPFLARRPPKSTGREEFGLELLETVNERGISDADLMATLTHFTALTIVESIKQYWPCRQPMHEVVASGGGVHNKELMRMLAELLDGQKLRLIDEFGVEADAKEAVAFAVIADRTMRGLPGNLPSATGARHAVVLGSITPAG